jgi:hypothetical protein
MSQPVKCDICKKEVKNLGSHMYHSHGESQQVEFITDKELASTISQIENIVKRYRNKTEIKIKVQDGKQEQVELLITIQMK